MVNENSIAAVQAARKTGPFVFPLYDSYCFANIPGTLKRLLTGASQTAQLPSDVLQGLPERYDTVVLILIDAFGWDQLEKYHKQYPFLARFFRDGVVSKLTSQFPSTTSAHVTTIQTGLPVYESGIFEWFYYEPKVDAVIAPLLYSFAGDTQRGTLTRTNVRAEDLFPTQTLYQSLANSEVHSFVLQNQAISSSVYNSVVSRGATPVPFGSSRSGISQLTRHLLGNKNPSYYYFYLDSLDAEGHTYGPNSPETEREADRLFSALEEDFLRKVAGKLRKTLLLVTADHGQMEIDPKTTVYLDKQTPEITPCLRTNRAGLPLVPVGAPRDMFLYVQDGYRDYCINLLSDRLSEIADVFSVEELSEQGVFGPQGPGEKLQERMGNIVILPRENQSVWWLGDGRFRVSLHGHHGGLSTLEMETIFLAMPLE